jgi:hypothetical protein
MTTTRPISANLVRQLLHYTPDDGKLVWLPRSPELFDERKKSAEFCSRAFNAQFAGREAFTSTGVHGYRIGSIFNHDYLAHRIIWLLVHGEMPREQIDHINGKRDDNRLANLREATAAENSRNRNPRLGFSSRFTGVSWNKDSLKWEAYICPGGKKVKLGYFASEIDAARAYDSAAIAEFGNFARPNFLSEATP